MTENDPFGYRDDLRDSWADPDLRGGAPKVSAAAYRLALAQGRCALWGIEAGDELARPLPPELAGAAADELARRLKDWSADAESLGQRWDEAIDPAEGDEWCARLLKCRTDAWAIQTALSRAHLTASTAALDSGLDRLGDTVDLFDRALEAQVDVLSTLSGTRLLDNWRGALAPEYREDLPWWLDGSLEEVARRIGEEADRTLPGRLRPNGEGGGE